jgi:hypothetical protein
VKLDHLLPLRHCERRPPASHDLGWVLSYISYLKGFCVSYVPPLMDRLLSVVYPQIGVEQYLEVDTADGCSVVTQTKLSVLPLCLSIL